MTFGDLHRAIIAAFDVKIGRRSRRERLEELTQSMEPALLYWR